jgi:hypothetical protein
MWIVIRSHLRAQPWQIAMLCSRSDNSSAFAGPMAHPAQHRTKRPSPLNVRTTVIIMDGSTQSAHNCNTFAASDNSLLGVWFRESSAIFGLLKVGFNCKDFGPSKKGSFPLVNIGVYQQF